MSAVMGIPQSLKYSLFVIFHPFKGFWELKREKKGNIRTACVLLALLTVTSILHRQMTGFIYNYNNVSDVNIPLEICRVVLPFLLWCVSNWCITTLVDGEGTFADIFITTAFATVPLILINIPLTLLSNVITFQQKGFYSLFGVVSVVWSGLLLFSGIMTIHQFSMKKTVLTVLIALLGMVVMLFLALLFVVLIQQICNFGLLLYKEWSLRL